MRRTYKGDIKELLPNEIFVFGANTEGRHGKGAALYAYQNFGAIYGRCHGMQGQSYAIITKDLTKKKQPSRTVGQIMQEIHGLYVFAKENPDKDFFIAYKGEGTNLNFYSPEEMAMMFRIEEIPDNIIFEEKFNELIEKI
jgi:hypothetical protein